MARMGCRAAGPILLLLVATALPAGRDAWAQPRIVLEPVVGGLESPLYVTHARDGSGRLFIVERAGRIQVLRPGAVEPTVFLDLSPRALLGGEQGLLGLAFHPAYPANGRLFVNYTRRPDGATVIAEYRVSPADPDRAGAAETVVLVVPQPFENHNGGMIEFGPDGLLYIGLGDGGSSNDPGARTQNVDELLGKFLRIDVDHPAAGLAYSSPPTNPFAGSVPGRDEIFAVGFRNPWRFSFDRATGALYAGDVGQDAIEEIDVVTLGGNFGWRVFEGTRCTGNDPSRCAAPGFTPPIAEYAHAGGRCSITGGYVYRGRRGTLASGAYVFGDFCSGEIFMRRDGAQSVLLPSGLAIASFGEDGAGELYVVDLGGTVYRIVNPEAIRLGLTLNRSITRPAEILTVDVTEENPGVAQIVDQYLGALLPPETGPAAGCPANDPVAFVREGGAAVIVTCLSTPPFPAFARGVVVPATAPAATRRVFTIPWSATSPAGAYLAFVAYARPGAAPAPDVIAIAAAAFTASP